MSDHSSHASVWFFIGLLLTVYGILITGSAIMNWSSGFQEKVVLGNLHMDVWWGLLMLATGLFYTVQFRPNKGK